VGVYHVDESQNYDGHVGTVLVGPGGFECTLTEPEDRTWYRDGTNVVDELNRLYEQIQVLKLTQSLEGRTPHKLTSARRVETWGELHEALERGYPVKESK
jgi:hypothetical protein